MSTYGVGTIQNRMELNNDEIRMHSIIDCNGIGIFLKNHDNTIYLDNEVLEQIDQLRKLIITYHTIINKNS